MYRRVAAAVSAVILLVAMSASASSLPGERPLTTEERVRRVEAITYEEEAPYFEARYVVKPDGLPWHCEGLDNFSRLPDSELHRKLAEIATLALYDSGYRFAHLLQWQFPVGESPWGVFTGVPEIRKAMEPVFEETKRSLVERIREGVGKAN